MKCLVVTDKDPGIFETIVALEDLFPNKLRYRESEVRNNLKSPYNINIIAANDDGNIIGYILLIPHEEAVEYLKEDDPLMEYNYKKTGYIDQIAVVTNPGIDKYKVFNNLIECLTRESEKRGFEQWSAHLAIPIDVIIRRKFNGKILTNKTRSVTMPSYDGIFVYMEGLP
jgi:hypothetical protein